MHSSKVFDMSNFSWNTEPRAFLNHYSQKESTTSVEKVAKNERKVSKPLPTLTKTDSEYVFLYMHKDGMILYSLHDEFMRI